MAEGEPAPIFILYVADQARSRAFYRQVLQAEPVLDVPGMTEFALPGGALLGLMPEQNIRRILGEAVPAPQLGSGIPRCELYLFVAEPGRVLERAMAAGAKMLSPLAPRNWGDTAVYVADPDGHIVVFAQKTPV